MDKVLEAFRRERTARAGYGVAQTLAISASENDPDLLRRFYSDAKPYNVKGEVRDRITYARHFRMSSEESNGWVEVYIAYWKALGEIFATEDGVQEASWAKVYGAWRELINAIHRGYTNFGFEAWTIPILYTTAKSLREFAIKADEERNSKPMESTANFDDFDTEAEKHQQLEDCARQLNRLFTLCLNDRAPLDESRKWGIYSIINLLFKTYFRLNSASLSRNILRALNAYKGDMPALTSFPASQICTFKYYEGVLEFLEENYPAAEKHLTEAFINCHKDALGNRERILTYLIPCHLLTSHTLPKPKLLQPHPRLQRLFAPLAASIKKGDLQGFDQALKDGEEEFVHLRIYLTLERGRDIALRNLCRKVFIAGGFEEPKEEGAKPMRRTRVPIAEFQAAFNIGSGTSMDKDEVECLLSNMIYKNMMKGYIARERGFVVLSKAGAFPMTGL